ncbi:MAG: hypothetical protein AAGC55_33025, partial [Myxococcota bacterium]
ALVVLVVLYLTRGMWAPDRDPAEVPGDGGVELSDSELATGGASADSGAPARDAPIAVIAEGRDGGDGSGPGAGRDSGDGSDGDSALGRDAGADSAAALVDSGGQDGGADRDAQTETAVRPTEQPGDGGPAGDGGPGSGTTGPPLPETPRPFTLIVSPHSGAEYRIAGAAWTAITRRDTALQLAPGRKVIEVRNPQCCQSQSVPIAADRPGGPIEVQLGFLPAQITPECAVPGVLVQVDGRSARLGEARTVIIDSTLGSETVVVTFIGERPDTHRVRVRYKEVKVVTCSFD